MSADSPTGDHTRHVLAQVYGEREHQDVKHPHPVLDRPDGTGRPGDEADRNLAQLATDMAAQAGTVTWRHVFMEEVHESLAETDPAALRDELVQVAAVAVAWCEAIDRREARR